MRPVRGVGRPAGMDDGEERFLELVLADPTVATILEGAPGLGVGN